MKTGPISDWLGMVASVACAIHCAAMPFVIGFLPMLGISFLADEVFHQVMVFVCLGLAGVSFVPGFRKHRRYMPVALGGLGLALIASAAFFLEGECCAACEAAESPGLADANLVSAKETVSADSAGASSVEATTSDSECEESCCEHCAPPKSDDSTSETSADDLVGETQLASLGGPFIPWITPLGGLLLVTAHVSNRRFICRDGCCPSDKSVAA